MKQEKSNVKSDFDFEDKKTNDYQCSASHFYSKYTIQTNNNNSQQIPETIENVEEPNSSFKKKYIIIIGIIVLIIIIIAVVLLSLLKKTNPSNEPEPHFEEPTNNITENSLNSTPINPKHEDPSHINTEFKFKLDNKDLKRLLVEQIYEKNVMIEGYKIINNVFRKTIYDLFVLSEEKVDEEKKNLYDKKYTVAMLVNSQCVSTKNKDCVPKKMINMTKINTENIQNILNNLDKLPDNIPIGLCLFELTDNDVITSITCPEKIHKNIKENMILDLYFYRPPAIKNPDNITDIKFDKVKIDDKYYIRKRKVGICDIVEAFNSFCTTEFNVTTDLNGVLLTYDEQATAKIKKDDKNSYSKNKTTNLVDNSKEIENIDKISYEKVLNKIISKLKPFMRTEELFSNERFEILYKKTKNIADEKEKKRNLADEKPTAILDKNILEFSTSGGIKFSFNYKNDLGLNTDSMKANSYLKINDNITEISSVNFVLNNKQNIGEILNELIIFKKAGYELLLELYNKMYDILDNKTSIILKNLTNVIDIVPNNTLSEIFDSSLTLNNIPDYIIEESTSLSNKLLSIYNEINNGGMKNDISDLNNNIYEYVQNCHILVNEIFKKVQSLSQCLNSPKSKLTEISTYFLNNTPSSFIGIINEAQDILMNYYKKEKDLILEELQGALNVFESGIKLSIENEEKRLENLYSNLKDENTILNENSENLILNLENIKKYLFDIISKGKEKIKNEMNLKDSGYFISNYDINNNNISYDQLLKEANENILKLDNDEYNDKVFCNTMNQFKDNYTNLCKYMNQIKKEQFLLYDDALNTTYFTDEVKKSCDLDDLGFQVYDSVRNENNKYLHNVSEIVEKFFDENKDYLNNLILNLTLLLSEDSLEKLSYNIEKEINNSLKQIHSDININNNLSNEYFEKLINVINDDDNILELLKNYKDEEIPEVLRRFDDDPQNHYMKLITFVDSITSKSITKEYIRKYNNYLNNLNDANNYIENELYKDLKNEYSKIKLRETLLKIKNNKISDVFPNFPELKFIDKNIKQIDKLIQKFEKYFSDEIFDNYYISKINNFKDEEKNFISNIDSNIQNFNTNITNNKNKDEINDYKNDFCVHYYRKITYTCTNSQLTEYVDKNDYFCFPLIKETNNNEKLITISINSKPKPFENFNKFYLEINEIVDSYNIKITELKENLFELQKNALKNTEINKKLENLKNRIDKILNDNYGEKLIINTHNFLKERINNSLINIFDDIKNKWINLFSDLKTEVSNNLDNYKNSINEFGVYAFLYQQIIIKNISTNFYDSIISQQKNEFNYTISYYYNYLHKLINSTYQLILSKIPLNKKGLDVIVKERENKINSVFSEIFQMFFNSKNNALNYNSQFYTLQVPETNFFNTNEILVSSQKNLNSSLTNLANSIYLLKNNKNNDEYSLTLKFYLENSENGKQINDFYDEVNNHVFIYLNLEKFKETILNNWIFDQDNFIKNLNNTLYYSNLEISKELEIIKEEFTSSLENLITKYFTKDEIIKKINDLYLKSYKYLENDEINLINKNIQEQIQKIKDYLISEYNRIESTLTSYNNDFSKINSTINEYKIQIFSNVNKTIFNVLEEIYENIYLNAYNNFFEYYLNNLTEVVESNITSEDLNLLNSTLNLHKIIHNILDDLINEYKNITNLQIKKEYENYYYNISNKLNLNSIKNNINQQIDEQFNILYEILSKNAINNVEDYGYVNYDLSDKIKNEINNFLKEKNENIQEIIQKTKGENCEKIIRNWINRPDYTRIINEIENIKNSFKNFYNKQKLNEQMKIDEFLQKIIKENFIDLLKNLIPSFGNDFFNRIILYNKNFKIVSLYNNLKLGLSESLSYYINILKLNTIKTLTKDLKLKIFSLNDLDEIIKENHKKILDNLNKTTDDFIIETRTILKNNYISYIKSDISINLAFNNKIIKRLNSNINIIESELENEYNKLMKQYMKDKLIDSYTKMLTEYSNEMINDVQSQRDYITLKFNDIFIIDPDEELNNINDKVNSTKQAIKNYYEYLNSFKISQNLLNYVENFGYNKIKPFYFEFLNAFNENSNSEITNIENYLKLFENYFNKDKISNLNNSLLNYINNEYINILNNLILSYGIDDYKKNLNNKINEKLRLLENNENENLYYKRVADKSIDETFDKLISKSNYTKNFIKNYQFFEFVNNLNEKIETLNKEYTIYTNVIKKNNMNENNNIIILNKLEYLKNLASEYYYKINETFYQIKFYLDSSIDEIDNLLNLCANETFSTFQEKYITLSKKVEKIEENEEEEKNFVDEKKFEFEDYYINVNITNIKKKADFKFNFDIKEINNLKIPKFYAHVINLSVPKKITIEIYKVIDNCKKNFEIREYEFNKVNYSIFLDFNIDSNNINIHEITDFEYKYTIEGYDEEEDSESEEDICDEKDNDDDYNDFLVSIKCQIKNAENLNSCGKMKKITTVPKILKNNEEKSEKDINLSY